MPRTVFRNGNLEKILPFLLKKQKMRKMFVKNKSVIKEIG